MMANSLKLLPLLLPLFHQCSSSHVQVTVEGEVTSTLSDKFLSFAIDSGLIKENWRELNFSSPKLNTLVTSLLPTYWRLGGTSADLVIFNATSVARQNTHNRNPATGSTTTGFSQLEHPVIKNFTMTRKQVDEVLTFVANTGVHLIFDVNVMLRTYTQSGNQWNPENFKTLLEYIIQKNITSNISFELGNEPIAYEQLFKLPISGKQLAKDFKILRSVLLNGPWSEVFGKSLILGPSIERPEVKKSMPYLKEFLAECEGCVTAVSWHHYYGSGRVMDVSDFTSLKYLDNLQPQVDKVKDVVGNSSMPDHTPIWLGETSSSYGGGAPGISDRFVAGFLWLDKLGVSAKRGLQVVIRQSLYGGNYALLDPNMDPNPDYWLTLLYKNLVGSTVLKASSNETYFRVYAHCSNPKSNYKQGAVTVYFLSLKKHSIKMTLDGDKDVFLLTSDSLTSTHVFLNGKQLAMVSDKELPPLKPVPLKSQDKVNVPAYSFGFVVLPNAAVEACKTKQQN